MEGEQKKRAAVKQPEAKATTAKPAVKKTVPAVKTPVSTVKKTASTEGSAKPAVKKATSSGNPVRPVSTKNADSTVKKAVKRTAVNPASGEGTVRKSASSDKKQAVSPKVLAARRARKRRQQRNRRILLTVVALLGILVLAAVIFIVTRALNRNSGKDGFVPNSTVTAVPTAEVTEETAEAEPPEQQVAPMVEALTDTKDLSGLTEGGLKLTGTAQENVLPYQIHLSKKSFAFAILGLDENGEYTRVLRSFTTAIGTGNKTRAGTYTIEKKYDWYSWSLGGFTPYTTKLADSKIRIHATLHKVDGDFDSMYVHEYGEIGTANTQGCMRTTAEAAAWVYYNCDKGTKVIIGNDDIYQGNEVAKVKEGTKRDPTIPTEETLELPITYFTVDSETVTMKVGETYSLNVSGIKPEKHSGNIEYVSGNEDVLMVDANGVITAKAPGCVHVLVVSDDVNRVYREIEVTIQGE